MSRKKEKAPSLREKVKSFYRDLSGEASKKFLEVFCQLTESSSLKEGLSKKDIQKAFVIAKEAIAGLPGSKKEDQGDDEDEEN